MSNCLSAKAKINLAWAGAFTFAIAGFITLGAGSHENGPIDDYKYVYAAAACFFAALVCGIYAYMKHSDEMNPRIDQTLLLRPENHSLTP